MYAVQWFHPEKNKFNEMIENQTYHDIHAHDNGM